MKQKIILSGCLIINENDEILLLFKKSQKHYETPGGKVEKENCKDFEKPTIEELKEEAKRETFEELGENIVIEDPKYFDTVEFTIPDGREVVANKFLTRIISGEPRINEPETFSKLDYLPIENLEEFPISPDLRLLMPKLKEFLKSR